jgi:hypothetical protein
MNELCETGEYLALGHGKYARYIGGKLILDGRKRGRRGDTRLTIAGLTTLLNLESEIAWLAENREEHAIVGGFGLIISFFPGVDSSEDVLDIIEVRTGRRDSVFSITGLSYIECLAQFIKRQLLKPQPLK